MKKNGIIIFVLLITSCGFFKTPPSNEPETGNPTKTFDVNIEGDNLYKLLNLSLTNDTIKNVFQKLGKHKYSTSLDSYSPYARTGMYLYYEFEGIMFYFDGPDAGTNKKTDVEQMIKEYPDGYRLEQIEIEPLKYKGGLPKGIKQTDTPGKVEEILGKYNDHFGSASSTEKLEYFYPNHGLHVRFNFFPESISADSTICLVMITDSVTEMKRFPTIFTRYAE